MKKTRMFWVESPTNHSLKVIDIRSDVQLLPKALELCLSSITPSLRRSSSRLCLGADIVMRSTTKYIGGHSDIIGGAVMTSDDKLHEQIKYVQFAAGAVPGPFEAFLLLRSIKTLAIRMEKHERIWQKLPSFWRL